MSFVTTGAALAVFLAMGARLCFVTIQWRHVLEKESQARRDAQLAQEQSRNLSLVLANMHEEVYFMSVDGEYTFANPTALREFRGIPLIGVKARELVEQLVILKADGSPRPHAETPALRSLAGEVVEDEEQIVLTPRTGEMRNRLISSTPVRDATGKIIGAVSTVRDITALKQVEASLRDADRRKNVFLATLAHELRNPLAPIRTAAQLLVSVKSAQDLDKCRSIISRQVAHMASLLDDLLDVSRFSRGELTLKKSYARLGDILDAAVEAAQPLIAAKHHTLQRHAPAGAVMLEVDSVRLTQIVSNLLTNAAKYTNPGGDIALLAEVSDRGLSISVRDSGIGLELQDQRKIFDMFVQVSRDEDRAEGGLGIGLALVKGLVELHGGRIQVVSAGAGLGSTFTVCLPDCVVVETPRAALAAANDPVRHAEVRRVLVADDNQDGADTMQILLESRGHEVYVARNGFEALEMAARVKPEVAIIDIGMPGLSGYEVATRIRDEAWGGRIALVALTGWGRADDKHKALAAGFDHHLTKPADPDVLDGIVAGLPGRPWMGGAFISSR
jgi:PAS domain S-box-containing protein